MNDAETLETVKILIAALRKGRRTHVQHDADTFRAAVRKERLNWSAFAARFRFDGDIDKALSVAHAACLIGWISPAYRTFIIRMSSREAAEILAQTPERTVREAQNLAAAWLDGVAVNA